MNSFSDLQDRDLLANLNPPQKEAVQHYLGPMLILAGAGSGKTRVLTRRVANLVVNHKVDPRRILAVTFTNKAANEMRERLQGLLHEDIKRLWVATFHSAGLRMLRQHAKLLSYGNDFLVYDDQDSTSLLKSIIKAKKLDDKKYPASFFSRMIDDSKNAFVLPEEYCAQSGQSYENDLVGQVYLEYQKALKSANAMDFGDLLVNAVLVLKHFPDVLRLYQHSIQFVLVDEYQDTNMVQYLFVSMLTKLHQNLFVVGDDDQSIYAFRGASIRNILEFEKDFPGTKVVKLEQNYRSTSVILSAAHAVIEKNRRRKDKKLWTEREGGDPIVTFVGNDEMDEADFVAAQIRAHMENGLPPSALAIFYRTNAQSRALEEALMNHRIPYRIFGGLKFYERKEIKDTLAYLRLIISESDNQSFLRVVNTPARGIGAKGIQSLSIIATTENISLLQAARQLKGKSAGLKSFCELIDTLRELSLTLCLSELIKKILELSGYEKSLLVSKDANSLSRIENLRELEAVGLSMESAHEDPRQTLAEFLDRVSLTSGSDVPTGENDFKDQAELLEAASRGYVSLMTLHLAKGLEFPVVFLTGMEEGLLPHYRAMTDPRETEEERRITYVGMTRAMNQLYLTRTFVRGMFASGGFGSRFRDVSRFACDIPEEYMKHAGLDFLSGFSRENRQDLEGNDDY